MQILYRKFRLLKNVIPLVSSCIFNSEILLSMKIYGRRLLTSQLDLIGVGGRGWVGRGRGRGGGNAIYLPDLRQMRLNSCLWPDCTVNNEGMRVWWGR